MQLTQTCFCCDETSPNYTLCRHHLKAWHNYLDMKGGEAANAWMDRAKNKEFIRSKIIAYQ